MSKKNPHTMPGSKSYMSHKRFPKGSKVTKGAKQEAVARVSSVKTNPNA